MSQSGSQSGSSESATDPKVCQWVTAACVDSTWTWTQSTVTGIASGDSKRAWAKTRIRYSGPCFKTMYHKLPVALNLRVAAQAFGARGTGHDAGVPVGWCGKTIITRVVAPQAQAGHRTQRPWNLWPWPPWRCATEWPCRSLRRPGLPRPWHPAPLTDTWSSDSELPKARRPRPAAALGGSLSTVSAGEVLTCLEPGAQGPQAFKLSRNGPNGPTEVECTPRCSVLERAEGRVMRGQGSGSMAARSCRRP